MRLALRRLTQRPSFQISRLILVWEAHQLIVALLRTSHKIQERNFRPHGIGEAKMSQVGQIISVSPFPFGNDWMVLYSYQPDAGGIQQAEIIVGNTAAPSASPPYPATVAFWASPSSTVTVTPNPPGTRNPVLLSCPDLVKWAAFGVAVKGLPKQ